MSEGVVDINVNTIEGALVECLENHDHGEVKINLSDDQIKEFRDVFNGFDKDGGGNIEAEELALVMKALGQDPTKEQLDAMVKKVDTDGSGEIDFDEFLLLMQ